ncbi:MAG: ROK family protein [Candidatus Buchananbacteria bacterium]
MNKDFQLAIGFDFGGSHLAMALVKSDGAIVGSINKTEINPANSADFITKQFLELINKCKQQANNLNCKIIGIGGGSPGPLDFKTFTLSESVPNLPTLRNFSLGKILSEISGLPVFANNDANVFTLGETIYGAGLAKNGKPGSVVFGCTLGTGFGTGLVINGTIFNGAHNLAMEHAFSPYITNEVIETEISTKAIMNNYAKLKNENLNTIEIAKKAYAKEKEAVAVWQRFGNALGYALAWITNSIDPEIIVIGGGLSKVYDLFFDSMIETILKFRPIEKSDLKIEVSKLNEQAIIKGGAYLVFNNYK